MPARTREERLFGAACLRVTLEQRAGGDPAGNEIYRATLQDLKLTEAEVDGYLADHRREVESALATRLAGRTD